MSDCARCDERIALWRQWDRKGIESIRRVLECHALGAEVIARKDEKYERLNALHALESLSKIEKRLAALTDDELRRLDV